MPEKAFIIQINPVDRIQHRRLIVRGKVLEFLVQYEGWFEGKWIPIVRYDTAHGFAHRDLMLPNGEYRKQRLFLQDFNEAYTFAASDVQNNWQRYRDQFELESRRQK
jgi:hypothetical protein